MHVPVGVQYLCICPSENLLDSFYQVEGSIFEKFGIKLNVQLKTLASCLDMLKTDTDRSFVIIVNVENHNLQAKVVSELYGAIYGSPRHHKLIIINHSNAQDTSAQIYSELLSSLNLSIISVRDGYLQTFGISFAAADPEIPDSTLVKPFPGPARVELSNIKPIILDKTRCGVLVPIMYFIAKDFGTCISQILLPNEDEWKLAYLIQCDESDRNDLDMVKICLVNPEEPGDASQPAIIAKGLKDSDSVLHDPRYPLCQTLLSCIHALNNESSASDSIIPILLETISDTLAFATRDDASIFPDVGADNIIQIKKRYNRLLIEFLPYLLDVKDHHQEEKLKVSIKNIRRTMNFLGRDINEATKISDNFINKCKWLKDAVSHSDPDTRFWGDVKKVKLQRIANEERDGLVAMPRLEPYLEIKWPKTDSFTKIYKDSHPVMDAHLRNVRDRELNLLANKRFGI